MYNSLTPIMAEQHRRDLLKDAAQSRARVTSAARPSIKERLFIRVGGLLVSAGLWMQRRYLPTIYVRPETTRSGH
jgi:hypothetical protein